MKIRRRRARQVSLLFTVSMIFLISGRKNMLLLNKAVSIFLIVIPTRAGAISRDTHWAIASTLSSKQRSRTCTAKPASINEAATYSSPTGMTGGVCSLFGILYQYVFFLFIVRRHHKQLNNIILVFTFMLGNPVEDYPRPVQNRGQFRAT